MPKSKSSKLWPVADAMFVEVEISHSRERQMHILFVAHQYACEG
jgi:hypothetical protein